MKKVLLLLFMTISSFVFGQVRTDWQVDGLKGKVKKVMITCSNAVGDENRIEKMYDEKGYLLHEIHLNSVDSIEDIEMKYDVFKEYTRYIYVKAKSDKEYSDIVENKRGGDYKMYLNVLNYERADRRIVDEYQQDRRTLTEESYVKYDKYLSTVYRKMFEYDEKGTLVKEVVKEEINGVKNKYVLIYDIRSRDAIGNVLLQTKRNSETGDIITEQFDYLYYK